MQHNDKASYDLGVAALYDSRRAVSETLSSSLLAPRSLEGLLKNLNGMIKILSRNSSSASWTSRLTNENLDRCYSSYDQQSTKLPRPTEFISDEVLSEFMCPLRMRSSGGDSTPSRRRPTDEDLDPTQQQPSSPSRRSLLLPFEGTSSYYCYRLEDVNNRSHNDVSTSCAVISEEGTADESESSTLNCCPAHCSETLSSADTTTALWRQETRDLLGDLPPSDALNVSSFEINDHNSTKGDAITVLEGDSKRRDNNVCVSTNRNRCRAQSSDDSSASFSDLFRRPVLKSTNSGATAAAAANQRRQQHGENVSVLVRQQGEGYSTATTAPDESKTSVLGCCSTVFDCKSAAAGALSESQTESTPARKSDEVDTPTTTPSPTWGGMVGTDISDPAYRVKELEIENVTATQTITSRSSVEPEGREVLISCFGENAMRSIEFEDNYNMLEGGMCLRRRKRRRLFVIPLELYETRDAIIEGVYHGRHQGGLGTLDPGHLVPDEFKRCALESSRLTRSWSTGALSDFRHSERKKEQQVMIMNRRRSLNHRECAAVHLADDSIEDNASRWCRRRRDTTMVSSTSSQVVVSNSNSSFVSNSKSAAEKARRLMRLRRHFSFTPICSGGLSSPNSSSWTNQWPPSIIAKLTSGQSFDARLRLFKHISSMIRIASGSSRDIDAHIAPHYLKLVSNRHVGNVNFEIPQPAKSGLSLSSSAWSIPKPGKKNRGEDAYLTTSVGCSFIGVADGVGEWSEHGCSPQLFARALMEGARIGAMSIRTKLHQRDPELVDLQPSRLALNVLKCGFQKALSIDCCYGSATMLVAGTDHAGQKLGVANLGDSSIIILRRCPVTMNMTISQHILPSSSPREIRHSSSEVLSQSEPLADAARQSLLFKNMTIVKRIKEQQHFFNCPYQLSRVPTPDEYPALRAAGLHNLVDLLSHSSSEVLTDSPEEAALYDIDIQEGDLLIAGSDGLFDNLFDVEIVHLASLCLSPYDLKCALTRPSSCDDELRSHLWSEFMSLSANWINGTFSHPLITSPPLRDATFGIATPPQMIARAIAEAAFHRSLDPRGKTPFARQARMAGCPGPLAGGKSDDITVVAAWVLSS